MAAVCPKIQNGGQNDTFSIKENMRQYTTGTISCDFSVYLNISGYYEYIFVNKKIKKWPPSTRKFKMAARMMHNLAQVKL